jgi:hypothetical protein
MSKEFFDNPYLKPPNIKTIEAKGTIIDSWEQPGSKETIVCVTRDPKMFTQKVVIDASKPAKFQYCRENNPEGTFYKISTAHLRSVKIIK